jgi:hypothetical protein
VDLLDIRCFHNIVCVPRELQLRFLGFNSSASPASSEQTELNISLDEVRKLASIDATSDVIWDDFCRVGNQDSVAWKRAHEFGPYDVINLDLCDGFGAQPPGKLGDTHYKAVASLLSIQARTKHPWMLLLTTRAGKSFIHKDVLQSFLNRYIDNLASCVEFQELSAKKFSVGTEEQLTEASGEPAGMLALFLAGLCKWLVGLSAEHKPPTRVQVRSVIGYRVEKDAQCEDLISLAIRFEPTFFPVVDPDGLAHTAAGSVDECEAAVQVLNRIAGRKDADALLAQDAKLRKAMIKATADLLALARYDVDAFHDWISDPA